MRCKTLTAIYKNEINTLKKLYEIDFLIHKSVRIHIEQFTVRKIEIDFTSEQLVDDLIAVLTKVERMLSILIINPSNVVQINDGHIPTTKQDPLLHGFGIGNVKDILEKYHAEYLFTYDDGRFIFSADWPDIAEPPINTSILS